jgi:hypothetical protein
MDNINSELVDIVFINNTMIITYDKCAQTETLVVGKETYDKMYKEWLVGYPPTMDDKDLLLMNNIISSYIDNNQNSVESLNKYFVDNNKDNVIKFIKYMRCRYLTHLTQDRLKWNHRLFF